jgi:hypothetical protein
MPLLEGLFSTCLIFIPGHICILFCQKLVAGSANVWHQYRMKLQCKLLAFRDRPTKPEIFSLSGVRH